MHHVLVAQLIKISRNKTNIYYFIFVFFQKAADHRGALQPSQGRKEDLCQVFNLCTGSRRKPLLTSYWVFSQQKRRSKCWRNKPESFLKEKYLLKWNKQFTSHLSCKLQTDFQMWQRKFIWINQKYLNIVLNYSTWVNVLSYIARLLSCHFIRYTGLIL